LGGNFCSKPNPTVILSEDTSKSVVKAKLIISKKLLDLSIFIDEKDLLIDD
jgi:hypothetical protein